MIRTLRCTAAGILVVLGAACSAPDDVERGEGQLRPLDTTATADTLALHLSQLHRQLLAALAEGRTHELPELLSAGFRALDIRDSPEPASLIGTPSSGAEFTYVETMAGALGERVPSGFVDFTARETNGRVVSFAFGPDAAVRTTWVRSASGWTASHLLLMRRADGVRQLEREQ